MSSPWIDVAIAVAFVFFVFSMVVSGLNELINWVGQVRSKQLWSALHDLTTSDTGYGVDIPRAERQLWSRVLRFLHGLRDTFFRIPTGRTDLRPLVRPTAEPAQTAEPVGSAAFLSALRATAAFRSLETAIGGRTSIRHVPPTVFADALQELALRGDHELDRVLATLEPGSPLRRQIDGARHEIAADATAFRARVSGWFDDQMRELSRRYRKDARRVMFALGLVVAVAANVNAINVVASAQHDSDLRQALAVSASATVATGPDAACPTTSAGTASGRLECLRDEIARAQALKVTTFWDLQGPCRSGRPCSSWARRALDVVPAALDKIAHHPLAALGRLIGWLLSAIALSFGGAFWFDLLRRAVGYRRVHPA